MEEDNQIRATIRFYPEHFEHLKSINENVSSATRKLIEKDIKQDKYQFLERYMVLFAIGLMVITFATLITVPLFMGLQMAIGVVFLVYSVMRIFLWRINQNEMATRVR